MYPITEQVDVYGLLGYANTKISGSGGKLMDDGDFHGDLVHHIRLPKTSLYLQTL